MPIYDYVCSACGHRFEVVHGLHENGPSACPACGGAVSRAFAPPTIVFRGSGWARTDRRAASSPRKRAAARPDDAEPRPAEPGRAGSADSTTTADAGAGMSKAADAGAGDE